MLIFIIPLKSKQVSKNWNLVCKLFERTLRSVCNQTSHKFKAIVVCHELPNINFTHSHVTYFQVNFDIPDEDYWSKEKDKMHKMLVGMNIAQDYAPSHIMFVDADDCISKNLAQFVIKNNSCNGWVVNSGYEYREDIKSLIVRNKNFHLRTNTSHIIRNKLLEPYINMNIDDIKRENCILYHIDTAKILRNQGNPLVALPFKAVVYITDNGENMWWSQENILSQSSKSQLNKTLISLAKKLYQFTITKPLTVSISEEFGI